MGCANSKRPVSSSDSAAQHSEDIDVLVTQTHCTSEKGAVTMAEWACAACKTAGLEAFYDAQLAASTQLKRPQHVKLKQLVDHARCVVVTAAFDRFDQLVD